MTKAARKSATVTTLPTSVKVISVDGKTVHDGPIVEYPETATADMVVACGRSMLARGVDPAFIKTFFEHMAPLVYPDE